MKTPYLYAFVFLPLLFAFISCETKEAKGDIYPRQETLYLGGFDWAKPSNFNPLIGDPNFPIDGNFRLLYESLFTYNQLTGSLEPLLANSYEQTDSSVIVTLDSRAKWNDGKPVTKEDVLFTFHLDSCLPTPRHGIWNYLEKIESKENKIEFLFNKENKSPLMILNTIAETSILPKHIFEPLLRKVKTDNGYDYNKICEFTNTKPVVSGPYRLKEWTETQIILERDSAYWGRVLYGNQLPKPKYIIHTIYSGNNAFNNAMIQGHLDISSVFLPRIQTKSADSIRAWSLNPPYHLPGAIVTLLINHSKAPFDDIAFRKALVHLIHFEKINDVAISKYSPEIQPGLILPFGTEEQYFSAEDASRYSNKYSLESAKEILSEAGYSWNESGALLDKQGKVLAPVSIECPKGWTDWEDAIMVILGSLKEIGIAAEKKFVEYAVWDADLRLGTFDLAIKTQTAERSMATPWFRFQQLLYSKNLPKINQSAFYNQGRYKNEKVNELQEAIPSIADSSLLKKAYKDLNKIVMDEVPVVPLFYKPTQYYQFSTKYWTNYPTEENPYAPPENLITASGIKALWHIQKVQK